MGTETQYKEHMIEEYTVDKEPYYVPVGDEVSLFHAAYEEKMPILFKGPTGCGKTRFIEYMAYHLGRPMTSVKKQSKAIKDARIPLVTVACHEDLTASDLVGRYLLQGDETKWMDGPLTRAVKRGAICYLDEIVEARKDTTVIIHPLSDYRRILPVEKLGTVFEAAESFLLVISYNPGYQSALKDLKHSTRQRFIAMEFDYPPKDLEAEIIAHESSVDATTAESLATFGEKVRHLKGSGLLEGVSTRLLVYAGRLIARGIPPRRACQVAVVWSITDDVEAQQSIQEVASSLFE